MRLNGSSAGSPSNPIKSIRGDYLRHPSIALGSLAEVETLLTLCVRLKMIDRQTMLATWNQTQSTGKLLAALQRSLNPNPKPNPQNPKSDPE